MLSSLFRSLKVGSQRLTKRRAHRSAAQKKATNCRLLLEPLEDRLAPATFAEAGSLLNLDFNVANKSVAISSAGTSYALTLTGDTWSGTNSANVTGNGTATLTVTPAGLAAFDTINITDSAAGSAVNFSGGSYSDHFSVALDDAAAGQVAFSGSTSFTGTASLSASTSRNILVGGSLATVNGNLTLSANQQVTPTAGTFAGINVNGGVIQSTGTGAVTVQGKGGTFGNFQFGVQIHNGGDIIGGTSGLLTVQGTGGASTGSENVGVLVNNAGATITSSGGNVSVTGTGGGVSSSSSNSNYGVQVQFGGQIAAGLGGTVTVVGQGGTGQQDNNYGVYIFATTATITSSGGNVSVTGTGGGVGTSNSNYGVNVFAGTARITAGGSGSVTVVGQGGNLTGTGGFNVGVQVNGNGAGAAITSNGGNVSVTGTGGGTGSSQSNVGVLVTNSTIAAGGNITAGGSGTVTVVGQGGVSTGQSNRGVYVSNSAMITSSGGNVSVTGTGRGSNLNGQGVRVDGGGRITAGSSGTVAVVGNSNLTGNGSNNDGVEVNGTNSMITSSGGNVTVTGAGGGAGSGTSNVGVRVASAGQITAGVSGAVTVVGQGGNLTGTGADNHGVFVNNANSRITSSGGNVSVTGIEGGSASVAILGQASSAITTATSGGALTLIGNSMSFDATTTISAFTNSVTLRQRTNGVAIDLGAATNPSGGPLSLTDAELDRVTAGAINIGDTNSGNITVSTPITRATSTNIALTSGGNIVFNPGSISTAGGLLLLAPGSSGAVQPITSGADVNLTASTLSFASGSDLAIAINGTTVDTQYRQLNVAGAVDLTGVDLVLSGSHIPVVGQTFTIVNNDLADAITGAFNGLAEGATVTFNGVPLAISYIGGTGNDVVLTAQATNQPPGTPFDDDPAANSVAEGAANGSTVGVTAKSIDPNGDPVTYSLIDDAGGRFAIHPSTGVVTVADSTLLNYEDNTSHNITVQADDGNEPASTANFTIAVSNVNPSAPTDADAAANSVAEGAANGTTVGVTASSSDPNGPAVTYSLTDNAGGRFAIDASTGVVTVADSSLLNYENDTSHTITVQASDGAGGISTANFIIAVSNVNPSAPTDADAAANSVAEGAANGTTVGVTASSSDPHGPAVTYSLTDNVGGRFAIDALTGVVIVADSSLLNYENDTSHTITVQASDGAGGVSTANFTIAVSNINPSAPTDADAAANSVAEGAANGTTVGVTASSSDPNGPAVTYSLTDNAGGRFAIDASTGIVTVANSALLDGTASHTITVQASDGAGGASSGSFTIGVANLGPTATQNAYSTSSATPVAANVITDNTGSGADSDPAGANDPLTVSSYTQPANGTVVVAANGAFTYTPGSTFIGADSFSYTITDGDGGFATGTVTINVAAAPGNIQTIPDGSGTALLITGTSADDTILVQPGPTSSTLTVKFNGVTTTQPRPSGRIIVVGGAGNDIIEIAGSVTNQAWLYGEEGNDRLNAGNGGSLLIGGDGNDELLGGGGRDVMIGGQGADKLVGNANDDILVAGLTTKDSRSSTDHEIFWRDILAEWNSSNGFSTRVQNLRNGTGGNAHNNGSLLLPNVVDDAFGDEIDFLNGASGNDWLIFMAGEDRVVGQLEASN